MEISNDDLSKNTLFIRGIPATCSNETLSEVFSKAGAIKECFVVKYKTTNEENKKPCIGYVTFLSPDDARSVLRKGKEFSIDNSALKISFAKKKKFSKKKNKKLTGDTFEVVKSNDNSVKENSETNVIKDEKIVVQKAHNENVRDTNDTFTVMISGLPGLYKEEHVLGLWKKCGLKEPKELIFPSKNEEEKEQTDSKKLLQSAKFIVESKQAALKACNKLSGKTFGKKKNYTLTANFLTPEGNLKAARKSRLIVRNVSFQCSEEDLKKTFANYGTVTEVKIPLKPDGKKRGFAFVQFSHVFEAARAIKALNMQEIKGRKVAIDWSLPKEKYKEMNSANNEPIGERKDAEEDVGNGSLPVDVKEEKKSPQVSDSESSNETSDDSGLEDDDESEDDKDTSDNETEEESEDEQDNPYSKPLEKASASVKKVDPKSSFDVHEGRTVFVLNLSYDTTSEQLSEVLSEYGDLCYTKIVMNNDTGMSKGCAFAQYKTADEAKKSIEALGAERSGKMLDGREIRVVQALTRGDTDKMRKEGKKKKEKEDKRNLYLGREGLVRAGTRAAEGLSQIELKKREKIENAKRMKLKNPNIFVSRTRLCFHNLPKSVVEKELRELLLNQFKNGKLVRITECRIMRDLKNVNEKGIGRPLGYAFINFAKHENALKALRSLNNNPDIFGPIKRPIIEFALENKKVLEIKEQRKKKFMSKMKLKEKIQTDENSETKGKDKVKKIGRRERQKQKKQATSENLKEIDSKRQKNESTGKNNLQTSKEVPRNRKPVPKIAARERRGAANNEPEVKKPFQGSSGTTMTGKKLPMPAHSGPKIRQKNKGKILEQMRKSKKLNKKAAQQKLTQKYQERRSGGVKKSGKKTVEEYRSEKLSRKAQKRKKSVNEEAEFSALVAKYTKTFMRDTKRSDGKWYEA